MSTPKEVLAWDLSGLTTVAANASGLADAIVKAAATMQTTIHDGFTWTGQAKDAAQGKADKEQTEMRAVATAYDDLADACTGAHNEMDHPLSEIKTIFQNYVKPPVTVGDDWSVHNIADPDSDAGVQLARLPGLATTLLAADAKWGQKIADANTEIDRMAPAAALALEAGAITRIKKEDPKAVSDAIATNPASFWAPDIPAATASTIAGAMTEGTRMGLEGAAKDAGDAGVLKWVENWGQYGKDGHWTSGLTSGLSRFGIIGNAIGTVPAIADDIHGGMNPTEAVVSESGGTAAGMATGTAATALAAAGTDALVGAAAGSAVPGVGTAVGFVVGAGVGALTAYFTPKIIQKVWEW
ncbi:hypothetical protein [Nocardia terpenica]|uniref:WXG100 family type VII secretion target n=1 Tax=Nocardia terpenica TaxID=455432 RepID=A0A164H310_9NOCA|nr:hypothetical protein [Nocardia terpenica]KZM68158.1 hypothetical protein AWN90_09460 [Nocardia terpenica]NQE88982.1 hypothetical protein [Nocardia terpenica]